MQLHSFENMMRRVKRIDIQDGCVGNFSATVMGGSVIEMNPTLLPLAMVL